MHDSEPTRDVLLEAEPATAQDPKLDVQRVLFWALFLTAIAAFVLATVLAS